MAEINTGDTAWMLVCGALVLFMTPGLALFYAGMVRRKNVLSTTMHSFFAMGLVIDPVGGRRLHASRSATPTARSARSSAASTSSG